MKIISKVSQPEFELQFLGSEWYKEFYNSVRNKYERIISNPNLNDWQENFIRKELLWKWRYPLLGCLPLETEWNLIELEADEFENLLVIRETGWEKTFGTGKNLKEVAFAIKENVKDIGSVRFDIIHDIKNNVGKFEFKEKIILIGSSFNNPYTVVEGNHRAVAFELMRIETGQASHIPKQLILGVSNEMSSSPWLNFRHTQPNYS
ncbi:MAG: hypothetical protein US96_C0055G0008 [Candidatus Woesebacteria bacterium GW2011_GWB1_38_5b]|uniref:Uncharacterized protein n=1 Tax=Candidatus Woesebacteria bacterium GW2011_GWB1_38_5b TaxID=1618569 RepID=A0A0G0MJ05_9BACT|nr:MAG: hypothetical protein US96_C0055G0008 [Candidatus Woesebacteria bacterium GW2011_GWB1_38_5b]